MKERSILFNAPMVRAVLDDSKTQTRRIAKLTDAGHVKEPGGHRRWHPGDPNARLACPYGQPGDRLWVREAWRIGAWCEDDEELAIDYLASAPEKTPWIEVPESAAFEKYWIQSSDDCIEAGVATDCNGDYHWEPGQSPCRKRPSIHMPRWASRIMLEITAVRIERLQDISEEDAIAEGIFRLEYGGQISWRDYSLDDEWAEVSPMLESPVDSYRTLWESINGAGSWVANPFVWVVEFKKVTP